MKKQVVVIIGAGISGLLACKYAINKGFQPTVFEEQDNVGGLWNHTLKSTRLQSRKQSFQFSDFPWPSSVTEDFPGDTQLLDYLQSYAHHFKLLPYIKFKSRVIGIDYSGDHSYEEMQKWEQWGGTGKAFSSMGNWNIKVQHAEQNSIKEYTADFVILCIGRFSGLPNIPEYPKGRGPEVFDGKVLHSMELSAMDHADATELIRHKKVVIIGSQKSAVDVAALCANVNGGSKNPCTMIGRTPHWMLPAAECDQDIWGVPLSLLYFNRFSELLVHKPGEGWLLSALVTLLSPLRWGISKFVESYLRWKHPLKKYDMVPPHSFLQEMASCGISMVQHNFFEKIEGGSIIFRRSKTGSSFCKEGVIVDGETDDDQPPTVVKADIVILATGYRGDQKLRNIFTSPTFQKYISSSLNFSVPLYRQIIHPRIPQVAAIGYSESLNNLYGFEMRCKWLACFLDEYLELPSIKEMEKDALMWEKYWKRYAGDNYGRACVGLLHISHNDQLCRDIGCNSKRKKGFFSELLQPYGPADFAQATCTPYIYNS